MISPEPLLPVAYIVIGIILGIVLVGRAQRLFTSSRDGQGKCGICQQEGYLVRCMRCNRRVAMCHYYSFLFPDDPAPKLIGKRKSKQICSECLIPAARHVMDNL
jgi:hypothetical protein